MNGIMLARSYVKDNLLVTYNRLIMQ